MNQNSSESPVELDEIQNECGICESIFDPRSESYAHKYAHYVLNKKVIQQKLDSNGEITEPAVYYSGKLCGVCLDWVNDRPTSDLDPKPRPPKKIWYQPYRMYLTPEQMKLAVST